MRYYVNVGGRTLEVDIDGGVVRVEGHAFAAELARVADHGVHHLLVDGRSLVIVAREQSAGEWDLEVDGSRFRADVFDERTRAVREMTGRNAAPHGPKPVRAPMPGLIVRIEVEAGQSVHAGQGIAVVEAMKMENELKSEGNGIVARVLVQPGQAVEKGTVLVEFEGA